MKKQYISPLTEVVNVRTYRLLQDGTDIIKPDAIIIDVAIRPDENGGICGDLNYKKLVLQNHITPVPKGVGPMTVACLMLNSYLAGLAHN